MGVGIHLAGGAFPVAALAEPSFTVAALAEGTLRSAFAPAISAGWTATGSGLARPGFVDDERAPSHRISIHFCNRHLGLIVWQFNEAKTPALSCIAIGNDRRGLDGPPLCEQFRQLFLCRAKRKIANEQLLRHKLPS